MARIIGYNSDLFCKEDTYSLKGLCMLMIIIHHLFQWTSSRYGVSYPLPASILLQISGNFGSAIFLLISGYGLSLSLWKKKQTFSDTLRRLSKLYFPFVFFWVIGCIILLIDDSLNLRRNLLGLIRFDLPVVGGGKWFIVSIFFLYVLMIFLSWILKDKRKIVISVLLLVTVYIVIQIFIIKSSQPWYNTLISFPVGVLCACYKEKLQQIKKKNVGWILFIIFLFSFFLTQMCGTSHYWPTRNAYIYSPILMNLTSLSFALMAVIFTSVINIKCGLFSYIGVHSYTFFMGHLVLVTFAGRIQNVYAYIIFVLGGTFGLAYMYSVIQQIPQYLKARNIPNNYHTQ